MKKLFLTVLTGLAVTACTTPPAHVERSVGEQFREGTATYNDVLSTLGSPTSEMDIDSNKTSLCYNNTETEVNPAAVIPVIGLFFTGAKAETRTLCFIFENNILIEKWYSSQKTRVGLNAPE